MGRVEDVLETEPSSLVHASRVTVASSFAVGKRWARLMPRLV
jgi:hypothetical protein